MSETSHKASSAGVMSWRASAECRGMDPELFFPPKGAAGNAARSQARAVCFVCPVREQCLEAHLHERDGVWGGTTESERKRLRTRCGTQLVSSSVGSTEPTD